MVYFCFQVLFRVRTSSLADAAAYARTHATERRPRTAAALVSARRSASPDTRSLLASSLTRGSNGSTSGASTIHIFKLSTAADSLIHARNQWYRYRFRETVLGLGSTNASRMDR
eukprot:2898584-Pleurochrysis_carterae.AAC.1